MKIQDIKERTTPELNDLLADLAKKLFEFRTQMATQKLEDPTQIVKARKDVARIKTVLRERELASVQQ